MVKRKLTPKLRDYLYSNRSKVKLSDYDGEALAYLKRLRAATKAAKTRKNATAKIGDITIPRNSELYETIERSAEIKRQTVSTFIKKNKAAIQELMQDGRVVIQRETSYAISDISKLPAKSKVFINGERVTKGDAIYALQSLTSSAMQYTDTVVINYELSYDLTGNLYIELPDEEEIEEAEEADDEGEAFSDLLADSPGLVSIQSKGGKAA